MNYFQIANQCTVLELKAANIYIKFVILFLTLFSTIVMPKFEPWLVTGQVNTNHKKILKNLDSFFLRCLLFLVLL